MMVCNCVRANIVVIILFARILQLTKKEKIKKKKVLRMLIYLPQLRTRSHNKRTRKRRKRTYSPTT